MSNESGAARPVPVPGKPAAARHGGPRSGGPRALDLTLHLTDPDVVTDLRAHTEGRPRHDFAAAALRVGVLAFRQAQGRLDTDRLRTETDRFLAEVSRGLSDHRAGLAADLGTSLREYFDPENGRFPERVERLVSDGGEIERLVRSLVGDKDSALTRTLETWIGPDSELCRVLDPSGEKGIATTIRAMVQEMLDADRRTILSEFSLDREGSALARLVAEVGRKNGELTDGLGQRLGEVVGELSLDRKDSALSKLVGRLEATGDLVKSELTLDDDASALARLRKELLGLLEERSRQDSEFQRDILQKVTELAVRRREANRSTTHGHDFEEAVADFVRRHHERAGDTAERTGSTTGRVPRCKVGDVVVTLGPDCAPEGARIVLEAKEQANVGRAKALAELEQARENREAQLGIFVLSAKSAAEDAAPLARHGNDLLVVWDAEDPATDATLVAALECARALAVRAAQEDDERFDCSAMEEAIDRLARKLGGLAEIRKWAGTIENNAGKIRLKAEALREDADRQVETLRTEVARLGSEG